MQRNFDAALSAVLKHEGGYSNHRADPGGPTNLGITLATAKRLGIDVDGDGDTDIIDIKLLKPADAAKVYRVEYWDKVRGDDLPDGVDYAVFDFAVNSGVNRAAKYLQTVIGAKPDGRIGPETLRLVAKVKRTKVIKDICDRRMIFLRSLGTFPTFGKGWAARVEGVRTLAAQMAAQPAPPPFDLPDDHTPPTSAEPRRKTLMDLLKGLFVRAAARQIATQIKDAPGMNSNLIHNILNIAIAIVTILGLPEVAAVLPPDIALAIAGVAATAKVVINVLRDGLTGLVKEQPPVR